MSATRCPAPMATASASASAQELDREQYLQELIRGSMLDPPSSSSSSSRAGRVRPLTDDEIGWFYCEVCMEWKLVFDRFRVSDGCPHVFCVACVVGHIEARVAEGKVPVPCLLAAGCSGGGVMHPEACKKLLDIDVFDRWCVALCERAVGPGRARCPYRDCGELAVLEGAGGEAALRAAVSKASCPTCSRAFCLQCEEPWDDRHGDSDARCSLTQLAMGSDWRRCPSCRAMIDKIDGCKRMTCRCGAVFCYDCGSSFKPRKWSCKCSSRTSASSESERGGFIDLTCPGRQLHLGDDC
ncbi:E3 ubiquitin-protein ligase RNF14-like [Oryza brachyantha]|uniref:RBR-type E3 ubiquitin transferase n=1 Tax=Oryza brachyantha TaxID=4533 RepID=J3MXR8_ORYBR|nr:E3 ubiquitin-protein ligase RNF14-like [Oryza brachyantha]